MPFVGNKLILITIIMNLPLYTDNSESSQVVVRGAPVYANDSVTTYLEWTRENMFVSYTVTLFPSEAFIKKIVVNTSVQLTIPYNTQVNVSITKSICNCTLAVTSVTLEYSKMCILNFTKK